MKPQNYHGTKHVAVHDIISLIDDEESSSNIEDFQNINAEIVDFGISEDEDDECASVYSSSPRRDSVEPAVNPPNVLNKLAKPLSVKIVDFRKYPWYYRNTTQIVESQKLNDKPSTYVDVDISEVTDVACSQLNNGLVTNVSNGPTVNNHTKEDTGVKHTHMNKISHPKKVSKALVMRSERSNYKFKDDTDIQLALEQRNSAEIDFKKNQGLIGMKIRKQIFDETPKKISKKQEKKKCKEDSAMNKNEGIDETFKKSVVKLLNNMGTSITPIFDQNHNRTITTVDTNNRTEGPKLYDNDENNKSPPLLKASVIKYTTSLKCSLKIPSPKFIEDFKKIKRKDVQGIHIGMQNSITVASDADGVKTVQKIHNSEETKTDQVKILITSSVQDNNECIKDLKTIPKVSHNKKVTPHRPMPKCKRIQMDIKDAEQQNKDKSSNKNIEHLIKKIYKHNEKNKIDTNKLTISSQNHSNSTLLMEDTKYIHYKPKVDKTKDAQRRNKSFTVMNKLTKKVMKLIENNPKVDNKKLNTESDIIIKKLKDKVENIIENKPKVTSKILDVENVINNNVNTMPKQENKMTCTPNAKPNSTVAIAPKKYINSNIQENVRFGTATLQNFKVITRDSLLKPQDSNAIQYQKPNTNEKRDEGSSPKEKHSKTHTCIPIQLIKDNPQLNKSILNTECNLRVTDKHSSEMQTNGVTNSYFPDNSGKFIMGQSKAPASTLKWPQKLSQGLQNKVTAVHNSDNVEGCMKGNVTGTMTQPDLPKPLHAPTTIVQNVYPIQSIIAGESHQSGHNINKKPNPNVIIIRNHIQQNKLTPRNMNNSPYRPTIVNNLATTDATMPPPYSNYYRPDFRTNVPRPPMTLPPFPITPQTIRPHITLQQVPPPRRNVYQPSPIRPQLMSGYIQRGAHNNTQNNFTQRPVYNLTNCQRMPVNASSMPGPCSVQPNSVYWPYNVPAIIPPPPPPPPPPPLPPSCQAIVNPFHDSSIIGRNTEGMVKKINIPAPQTNSKNNVVDNKEVKGKVGNVSDQSPTLLNKESPHHLLDSTAPVATKKEMLEELEKVKIIESPVKNDTKRPLDSGVPKTTNLYGSRPGPLSKKMRFSNNVTPPLNNQRLPREQTLPSKGYSPPILPIPTFQKILSEVSIASIERPVTLLQPNVQATNIYENKLPRMSKKSMQTNKKIGDNGKKISLEEYKLRLDRYKKSEGFDQKMPSYDENATCRYASKGTPNSYKEINQNTEDLGYDSDSTVKL